MSENQGSSIAYMLVRDLKPGAKNVNLQFMVLEQLGNCYRTKEGTELRTFRVADRSGSINFCLFGEEGQHLKPGDICRLLRGYCAMFKTYLTVYVGKGGDLKRIGEFCFPICEEPNMSEIPFPPPASFMQQSGHSFASSSGMNAPGPSHAHGPLLSFGENHKGLRG
ncbi:SOSS complex subunit B2-like [Paramacrobiotus metropolitanus]|uniref:SOSS complex subunit B2-like n=1 Tax=Paramacrobiotus metropolitanus TaxID=2943436 RepID=UPI002445FE45|nr:SOSS complex subunit B2-like [Paramacrobiotus metropolitanus]